MGEKAFGDDISCIVMNQKDNVATLLCNVKKGDSLSYSLGVTSYQLAVLEDIKFGHKVAIHPIGEGELIFKYGETIGAATKRIEAGEHVHVHNLEGIRGRGDK